MYHRKGSVKKAASRHHVVRTVRKAICFYITRVLLRGMTTQPVWVSVILLYGLSTTTLSAPTCVPFFSIRAQSVPLIGLLHGVFVHLPSLWATSVHARRAIELMELLVYVHLLHILVLFLVEMYAPWYPASGVWTMAIYLQTQATWSVCCATRVPRSTLSSGLLQLSMLVSATGSVYALLRATCFTSAEGYELYQHHFIGLLASHVCILPVLLLPASRRC